MPVAVHLRAGILLFAAVILPMLLVWYPRPLFEAAGTAKLPCLVAVLAAVLGPVINYLKARDGRPLAKPTMRLLFAAQFIVLAGCALALYVQRPVYLVFTNDRFDLVLAREISPLDLAKAKGEFMRRPLGSPVYVAAPAPADQAEAQRILNIALGGGKDLQTYPQHFVPYANEARNALKRAKPLTGILSRDDGRLQRFLESSGRASEAVRYLPLRARKKDGVVLLDAATGMPLQVLLIDPW